MVRWHGYSKIIKEALIFAKKSFEVFFKTMKVFLYSSTYMSTQAHNYRLAIHIA